MIELRDVGLRLGRQTLVSGLDLTLPDPGLYVFEGGTGSGKSLLCELLGGRRKPTRGSLLVDGESLYGTFGLLTRSLVCSTVAAPPGGPQAFEEFVLDGLFEAGARPETASAVWPILEQCYPDAAAQPLDSLPLGLRCLAGVALGACAPLRLAVLDGLLDLLDEKALGCAMRLLGLALQRQEAFIVLASVRPGLGPSTARGRYRLHWEGQLRLAPLDGAAS